MTGALYLVWLGVAALRHPAAPDLNPESAPAARTRLCSKGVGISLLNAKVFLLFLALLPGSVSSSAVFPVGVQMIVLGVTLIVEKVVEPT